MRETNGTFEVCFGVVDVVRIVEEESGDAKTSLDLDDWGKGDFGLTNGFEAFDCFGDFAGVLVVLRQSPESRRHRLHRRRRRSSSRSPSSAAEEVK